MSHSFVRLLHSSQQPEAPRAKDETPQEQHNRKVSSVAPHATKHNTRNPLLTTLTPTADTADTERSPHFLLPSANPVVTKYLVTRHESTVTLAHTLLHWSGARDGARERLWCHHKTGGSVDAVEEINVPYIQPIGLFTSFSVLARNSIGFALSLRWLTFS